MVFTTLTNSFGDILLDTHIVEELFFVRIMQVGDHFKNSQFWIMLLVLKESENLLFFFRNQYVPEKLTPKVSFQSITVMIFVLSSPLKNIHIFVDIFNVPEHFFGLDCKINQD